MTGFVSFVGSGPGDPELLTLKAVDRLRRADAVLFDDLSSGPILGHARSGADLIGVGKRAGRASPRQHHVSRLLIEYAQVNQRVVRLKSGDSGLFWPSGGGADRAARGGHPLRDHSRRAIGHCRRRGSGHSADPAAVRAAGAVRHRA